MSCKLVEIHQLFERNNTRFVKITGAIKPYYVVTVNNTFDGKPEIMMTVQGNDFASQLRIDYARGGKEVYSDVIAHGALSLCRTMGEAKIARETKQYQERFKNIR